MTMQGYSDLPPSFKNHLAAAAERITSGDIDKVGDPVLFQALNSDPTKLASLSDGEFMLLASQLDSQELQILENQRAALKNGVKMDDAVPYSDINQIIDENWGDLGIKEQRESTDGKALKGYLVGYVAPVIRQLKLTKGPLSHAELTKHVLDILGTKVNKPGGIFSDGQTNVANWGSTEGSTREILAKAFGVQDEAALKGRAGVNLFLKLKNAPSVSVTDEYLPLPLRTRIREAYKGAFGKLPDARTTVYLAACMSEGDKIQVADVLGADGAARLMKAPESLSITDYIPEGPATQRGGRPYVEIYDPLVEGLLGDEKHTIEDR